jgi:hypothetical protein
VNGPPPSIRALGFASFFAAGFLSCLGLHLLFIVPELVGGSSGSTGREMAFVLVFCAAFALSAGLSGALLARTICGRRTRWAAIATATMVPIVSIPLFCGGLAVAENRLGFGFYAWWPAVPFVLLILCSPFVGNWMWARVQKPADDPTAR